MRKHLLGTALALVLAAPMVMPTAAFAQHHNYRWQGNRDHHWDPAKHYHSERHHRERRLGRHDHIYRGSDGRYYCRRSDGTTGLVVGAIAGGLLGNAVSGGTTLGTLLGAGGGALLGQSIDRGNIRCR